MRGEQQPASRHVEEARWTQGSESKLRAVRPCISLRPSLSGS